MSNLFKQYNIVEPHPDVRVIDYNPMVEEKLAALAKQQGVKGTAGDGFQELSLIAEDVPVESPEEAVKRQLQEAEDTLSRARQEADTLLSEAKEQALQLRQKAVEDGQKEGYDAGYSQVKEELEAEYGRRQEELEQFKLSLQEDYNQQMHDLEPRLLDAILTVVEKVFHIRFDDKKEILLYLIGDTIANVEGCKRFCIRVCREQKDYLEAHKEEILAQVGRDVLLEISADMSMDANGCVIETDTGIFDCGVGVQLENLIKDLRALSS